MDADFSCDEADEAMPRKNPSTDLPADAAASNLKLATLGVRDLALATGFSVATISRAINGGHHVSAATQAKVLAAVAAHNYQPNPAARALSTRRSRTIGAVIPTLAHSIYAKFLNAIEQTLAADGYALIIATTAGDPQIEAQRARALIELGAEGLIVSGLNRSDDFMRLVSGRRLPVVATSIFDKRSAIPTIGYDNRGLGRKSIQHLRELGHRDIAVLHGPLSDNDRTVRRVAGARAAVGEALVSFHEVTLNAEGGASGLRDAMAQRRPPTAVLALSDVLALGIVFEARRLGLRIPDDISVMGCDDLDWTSQCEPALTTWHLPVTEMGQCTARALVAHLDQGVTIKPQLLDSKIVVRDSTAAWGR